MLVESNYRFRGIRHWELGQGLGVASLGFGSKVLDLSGGVSGDLKIDLVGMYVSAGVDLSLPVEYSESIASDLSTGSSVYRVNGTQPLTSDDFSGPVVTFSVAAAFGGDLDAMAILFFDTSFNIWDLAIPLAPAIMPLRIWSRVRAIMFCSGQGWQSMIGVEGQVMAYWASVEHPRTDDNSSDYFWTSGISPEQRWRNDRNVALDSSAGGAIPRADVQLMMMNDAEMRQRFGRGSVPLLQVRDRLRARYPYWRGFLDAPHRSYRDEYAAPGVTINQPDALPRPR